MYSSRVSVAKPNSFQSRSIELNGSDSNRYHVASIMIPLAVEGDEDLPGKPESVWPHRPAPLSNLFRGLFGFLCYRRSLSKVKRDKSRDVLGPPMLTIQCPWSAEECVDDVVQRVLRICREMVSVAEEKKDNAEDRVIKQLKTKVVESRQNLTLFRLQASLRSPLEKLNKEVSMENQQPPLNSESSFILLPWKEENEEREMTTVTARKSAKRKRRKASRARQRAKEPEQEHSSLKEKLDALATKSLREQAEDHVSVPANLAIEEMNWKQGERFECMAKIVANGRRFVVVITAFLVAAMTAYIVINPGDLFTACGSHIARAVIMLLLAVLSVILNYFSALSLAAQRRFALIPADKKQLLDFCLLRNDLETGGRHRLVSFTFNAMAERRKICILFFAAICVLILGLGLIILESLVSSNVLTCCDAPTDIKSIVLLALIGAMYLTAAIVTIVCSIYYWLLMKDESWYSLLFLYNLFNEEAIEKGNTSIDGWKAMTGNCYRKDSNFEARVFIYKQRSLTVSPGKGIKQSLV